MDVSVSDKALAAKGVVLDDAAPCTPEAALTPAAVSAGGLDGVADRSVCDGVNVVASVTRDTADETMVTEVSNTTAVVDPTVDCASHGLEADQLACGTNSWSEAGDACGSWQDQARTTGGGSSWEEGDRMEVDTTVGTDENGSLRLSKEGAEHMLEDDEKLKKRLERCCGVKLEVPLEGGDVQVRSSSKAVGVAATAAVTRGILAVRAAEAFRQKSWMKVTKKDMNAPEVMKISIPKDSGEFISDHLKQNVLEEFDVVVALAEELADEEAEQKEEGFEAGQEVEAKFGSAFFDATVEEVWGNCIKIKYSYDNSIVDLTAADVRKKGAGAALEAAKDDVGFLLVFGVSRARYLVLLQVLVLCEQCSAGFVSRHTPASDKRKGFGLKVVSSALHRRILSKVARLQQAASVNMQVIGNLVFFVGLAEDRERGAVLVEVVSRPKEKEDDPIPAILDPIATRFVVIKDHIGRIVGPKRATLSAFEDEFGVFVVAESDPAGKLELTEGLVLEANYGGRWFAATVLDVLEGGSSAKVQWSYDVTQETVVTKAEMRMKTNEAEARLEGRTFVILGTERQRKGAELRLTALVEAWSPGSSRDAVTIGGSQELVVETAAMSRDESTALENVEIQQRVAAASRSVVQLVGYTAHVAGSDEERPRGLAYLRWVSSSLLSEDPQVFDAKSRDDIDILSVPQDKRQVLSASKRAEVEKETETVSFFGLPCDGEDTGEATLFICGHDATKRSTAVAKFKQLQDEIAWDWDDKAGSSEGTSNWGNSGGDASRWNEKSGSEWKVDDHRGGGASWKETSGGAGADWKPARSGGDWKETSGRRGGGGGGGWDTASTSSRGGGDRWNNKDRRAGGRDSGNKRGWESKKWNDGGGGDQKRGRWAGGGNDWGGSGDASGGGGNDWSGSGDASGGSGGTSGGSGGSCGHSGGSSSVSGGSATASPGASAVDGGAGGCGTSDLDWGGNSSVPVGGGCGVEAAAPAAPAVPEKNPWAVSFGAPSMAPSLAGVAAPFQVAGAQVPGQAPFSSGSQDEFQGTLKRINLAMQMHNLPQTVEQWAARQAEFWPDQAPMPQGWIRVWSRSKSQEYYVRFSDNLSVFTMQEVMTLTDGMF
eukprot:TRINITY_DN15249_c0_g2_i1.p1 TRINITY_DN15249_c0_g2~~TRINITY_DN15249_c0_g2_i1.p1  ORF type:complete len:1204 (-),score=298.97 TRINITY_DN15249_c0_g2_i1:54-3380(-)